MLYFDLLNAPDKELERLITNICTEFGTVVNVRVERGHIRSRAMVQMSNPVETIHLCAEFGELMNEQSVTIELRQRTE